MSNLPNLFNNWQLVNGTKWFKCNLSVNEDCRSTEYFGILISIKVHQLLKLVLVCSRNHLPWANERNQQVGETEDGKYRTESPLDKKY